MTVLLVEDHEDSRVVLSRLLDHCGHNVFVAENFQSAQEILQVLKVDALVSDLALPDRYGFDLAKEAKKQSPSVVAIALTALTSPVDRQRARDAGFDHFMAKPFDFHRLRSLLTASS